MNPNDKRQVEVERQSYSSLLDVLIRAGLILGLAILCFQIFSPFLALMMWALILAVTLYPAHQFIAAKVGGKQGLAATLLVALGIVLIVAGVSYLVDMLAAFLVPDVGKQIHGFLAIPPTIAEIWTLGYLLVKGVKTPAQGTSTVSAGKTSRALGEQFR